MLGYREVWVLDAEYKADPGERPVVHCLVAHELQSGRSLRLWRPDNCPFDTGPDTLFVAYFASAEWGAFLSLGWPLPTNVLCLHAEFRRMTNGNRSSINLPRASLLDACKLFGIDTIGAEEKESMRQLAIRGGPFTARERHDLVAYCESDVVVTAELYRRMSPAILDHRGRDARGNLGRALLRGRYTKAVAQMEHRGIPVDAALDRRITDNRDAIRQALIDEVDRHYHVYQGGTFRMAQFHQLLERRGLLESWPRTGGGALRTDQETMKDAARADASFSGLGELMKTLAQLKSNQLAIGADGRNRALLGPFGTKTGRNAPSTSKFIFGQAAWMRSLVRPEPGTALAYLDFGSQEIGIAAALSGDERLIADYRTDPYLGFAKRINLVPPDATKASHKPARDAMKPVVLGVNYGMAAESLARGTGRTIAEAQRLLHLHRTTYPRFWQWSDGIVDRSQRLGYLETALGWNLYAGDDNPRTFLNFPMQAHGADMLRLAACYLTEAGIGIVAPVHDAVLIEAPVAEIEAAIESTSQLMRRASREVLRGFEIKVGVEHIIRPGERYADPRGAEMFAAVERALVNFGKNVEHFDKNVYPSTSLLLP